MKTLERLRKLSLRMNMLQQADQAKTFISLEYNPADCLWHCQEHYGLADGIDVHKSAPTAELFPIPLSYRGVVIFTDREQNRAVITPDDFADLRAKHSEQASIVLASYDEDEGLNYHLKGEYKA